MRSSVLACTPVVSKCEGYACKQLAGHLAPFVVDLENGMKTYFLLVGLFISFLLASAAHGAAGDCYVRLYDLVFAGNESRRWNEQATHHAQNWQECYGHAIGFARQFAPTSGNDSWGRANWYYVYWSYTGVLFRSVDGSGYVTHASHPNRPNQGNSRVYTLERNY